MNLLATLIALFIERFVETIDNYKQFEWFSRFRQWFMDRYSHSQHWNDTAAVIAVVILPALLVGIVYHQLDNLALIFGFAFNILVLIYCLGPKRVHHTTKLYLEAADNNETEHAREFAANILGDDKLSDDMTENNYRLALRLLELTNERFLAVIFWFIILGPVGAIFYKLSSLIYDEATEAGIQYQVNNSEDEQPEQQDEQKPENYGFYVNGIVLYGIMSWLPGQLTTFGFAIAGSFVDVIHEWKNRLTHNFKDPNLARATVLSCGLKALQLDPENKTMDLPTLNNVLALCWRAIVVCLTVFAILSLAGITP